MSKGHQPVGLAIEWSPKGITAFDATTHHYQTFSPEEQLPFLGREALLAMARGTVFVRTVRVPNATRADVMTILTSRLAEWVPLNPSEVAFDFVPTQDVSVEGRLVLLVAVRLTDLRAARACLTTSGIRIQQVIPSAVGSMVLAHSMGLTDAVVLEQTEAGTSVDIVADGFLRLSRLVPPTASVDLEIGRACALAQLPCATVLAAGKMKYELSDRQTETRTLESLAKESVDRLIANLELPEDVAKNLLSLNRGRQRLAGLLLVAALAIGFVAYGDYSDAAGVVQKKTLVASKQVRKVKALQQAAEKAANDGLALKVAVDRAFLPAQSYADIVTVTTRDVPSSVWLSGLTFERGKPLLIRGTSKTNTGVADFLGALSKEDRFREVKLVFANNSMIEKTPVVQFSISAFPIGNLPTVDTAKKMPVPTAPKPPTGGNV